MWNIEQVEIVVNLFVIVKILFIAFVSACIMYSIEIGKLEGMLLEKYGKWLNKEKNRNKEIEIHNSQIVKNYEIGNTKIVDTHFLDLIAEPKYKKIIGGCGICTSFWIGLILGVIFLGINAIFVPFITVLIYQKL